MTKKRSIIAGRDVAIERGARIDEPWAGGLSDREYAFVQAYLQNLLLAEAAHAAGYNKSTAGRMAWEIIRRPHVREAIDAALQERFSAGKASITEKIAQMAFFNPGNVLSWDNKGLKVKSSSQLTAADWAGIEAVKMNKDGSIEVRFVDRLAALDKLARITGIARELPPAQEGNHVMFVIGDPEKVLEKHRAERARLIEDRANDPDHVSVPGEHTDLLIQDPK
jgi:hypothetical protein